jgi:uncharacterized protein YbjQ (UPF0145 family)
MQPPYQTPPPPPQGAPMLFTTTNALQGYKIAHYFGIVTGDAILVGGRSAAYEQELMKAKDIAMNEMAQRAYSMGANAIIGIDLDFETVGASGSMLMVSASGTAVRVEQGM